ncbi:hypothetical protein TW84_08100 [Vibrio neptunius]|nr:hypothetical protein TW84_08100 [Vibrio neptunius]
MKNNQYIKHPHFCQQCQSLTPHIQLTQMNRVDSKLEQTQSLIGHCIEFLMGLLSKSDEHTNRFFIDEEDQFQCEKCGAQSWH